MVINFISYVSTCNLNIIIIIIIIIMIIRKDEIKVSGQRKVEIKQIWNYFRMNFILNFNKNSAFNRKGIEN